MEKTEGNSKKTVIVIDEQGNKLESTYPKRAKGLIKNGRARVVDDNTICLVDLPKDTYLEEHKMNNNNINIEENKDTMIDITYIMKKIDEIIEMNRDLAKNPGLSQMSNVPGTKNPIQSICETNNKMIDFLQNIYKSLQPKESITEKVILELTNTLNNAIGDMSADSDVVNNLISIIADFGKK